MDDHDGTDAALGLMIQQMLGTSMDDALTAAGGVEIDVLLSGLVNVSFLAIGTLQRLGPNGFSGIERRLRERLIEFETIDTPYGFRAAGVGDAAEMLGPMIEHLRHPATTDFRFKKADPMRKLLGATAIAYASVDLLASRRKVRPLDQAKAMALAVRQTN